MTPTAVFAYGTLLPGDVRWPELQPFVTSVGTPDRADADLYDTGHGYPAAIFDGDARYRGGVVEGRVFELAPTSIDLALAHLDEIEDAVAGSYRRITITTHGGASAWAYGYGAGTTLAPIRSGVWIPAAPIGERTRTTPKLGL